VGRPTLAQVELDNSLLRTGRALIKAATRHPLPDGTFPTITLRLTRLDPASSLPRDNDPRIVQTIQLLGEMGINVVLGDLPDFVFAPPALPSGVDVPPVPTQHINLDLSILVALVSDLTHGPLPASLEEAELWFTPGEKYKEWKESRIRAGKAKPAGYAEESNRGRMSQTRALATQCMQEVRHGMIAEIAARIRTTGTTDVEFWTTREARDRCLRIVAKIGGPNEKRRAAALFKEDLDIASAAEEYWTDSRWPKSTLSLHPIHIFPQVTGQNTSKHVPPTSSFFDILCQTCQDLLVGGAVPDPRTSASTTQPDSANTTVRTDDGDEIERAAVTSANSKLTAHTVQSMLCGAVRGWTTLTANKGSIRTILKEMRSRNVGFGLSHKAHQESYQECNEATPAAFWVVEPRSLAEGMRSEMEM
jgi:hypothetical protein